MAFCFNTILLLLFALLPCSGGEGALRVPIAGGRGEYVPDTGPEAKIAGSRQLTFRFLDRVPELAVSCANRPVLPYPGHGAAGLGAGWVALEHRSLCLVARTLLHAAWSCHGLRGRDMIYPFHNFW
ncbi:hypothetical protein [Pontibacter liquoris]|uniref:hypothetical protein n=1 Tax=Pontibacter liquoris TaxID=2905677 RepID=UPI001FA6B242|nr:hypothetical protein [Pontibacter liquoris]